MRFCECHRLCFEHFCWSPLADVTVFGSPATPSFTFTYLGLFLLIVVIIFQQSKASDEQNQHKASKYWSNFAAGVLLCHCVTTLISFQTRPPLLYGVRTVYPCTFEPLYLYSPLPQLLCFHPNFFPTQTLIFHSTLAASVIAY